MLKRWVPELLSARELVGEESGDVVPSGERERRRVGLERLNEDETRRIAPAAAGELRDELKRSLLGPEVRECETRIRVDDRRHGDTGEMMALRDHLRPDEHCGACLGEAAERLTQRSGTGRRIGVETDPFEPRQASRELALEPLRPRADPGELDRPTFGTGLGKLLRVAAVMAVETSVAVQGEGDVAAPAAT